MSTSTYAKCFLAAALAALPAVSFAATSDSVLKDFEFKAADAADRAATLDANTRSPEVGWESYSVSLQALKDDINDMGRMLARLDTMRGSLTSADREVVDRAGATLKELAGNTSAAIQYSNRDRENYWTPTYRKYLTNMMAESDQLAASLNHAVELDKARAREKQLEKTLESAQ